METAAKNKHYCIFTAQYLPNLGGVERYTYNLAQALIKLGNHVTIVTSNVFSLSQQENLEGIDILRLPCWKALNGRFPVLKYGKTFRVFDKILRERYFDFVIVQSRYYIHSLYGVSFAKKKKIPCIVLEHGTNYCAVNKPVFDFFAHIYEHTITELVKIKCTHFFGVSQSCNRWLKHFRIQAEGVIYNSIDLDNIEAELADPPMSYREHFALQGKTVIVYAGRLVKEKGIFKLLSAVEKCRKENPDIVLLVAGDGELYEEIRKAEPKQVYMLGKLDFSHVVALYKEADIFCLPTDYPEGFPTAVLEAAACKCYIITTTSGGSKELVSDDSFGTVLTENTADNIADAISRVSQDRAYRESAVEKAYAKLCERFTWEKTALEVVKVAERLEND